MFTKKEIELLKGLVNLSLKNTDGMIRNLERKKQEKTITDKQKKMLEAFQKSRLSKQNLLKKLEEADKEGN